MDPAIEITYKWERQQQPHWMWVDGCVEKEQFVWYSVPSRRCKRSGWLFSEQFQLTPLVLTSHRLHTNVIRGSTSKEVMQRQWCHSKQLVHWTVGIDSSSTEMINVQRTISVVFTHHYCHICSWRRLCLLQPLCKQGISRAEWDYNVKQ